MELRKGRCWQDGMGNLNFTVNFTGGDNMRYNVRGRLDGVRGGGLDGVIGGAKDEMG